MTSRVLVVEDEPALARGLADHFRDEGYDVRVVGRGDQAIPALREYRPQLVVLDVVLPGRSGLDVVRELRAAGDRVPVLMLTAKGEVVDRVVGLELGADDYLCKPFNPRELVARLNALLRRRAPGGPPGAPAAVEHKLTFGACVLDLATRTLTRDGKPIALTTGEFALLRVLVEHPRKPLSREKLMELARGREHEAFDRAIDVQVSRLRKLIETHPSQPRFVQTVWGFGYVFVPDGGSQ